VSKYLKTKTGSLESAVLEAVSAAQQAAIAIAKKEKEEKNEETVAEKYTAKQYKMAFGVLNDPRWKGGNMTKIVDTIEKIAKGLSKDKAVYAAIKLTNEGKDIADIEKSVEEELTAKQKKIDLNKNGKVDGDDLKKLRAKKEEKFDESVNMTTYAQAITDMWKESAYGKKKVDKKEEKEDNGEVEGGQTMTGKPVSKVEVSPADKKDK
jgi:hypothetical protein